MLLYSSLDQVDDSGVGNVVSVITLDRPEDPEVNFFVKFGQFVVDDNTKSDLNGHEKCKKSETLRREQICRIWNFKKIIGKINTKPRRVVLPLTAPVHPIRQTEINKIPAATKTWAAR